MKNKKIWDQLINLILFFS